MLCLYRYGIVADEKGVNFSANNLWILFFVLLSILILLHYFKFMFSKKNIEIKTICSKYKVIIIILYFSILFIVIYGLFYVIDINVKLNKIN